MVDAAYIVTAALCVGGFFLTWLCVYCFDWTDFAARKRTRDRLRKQILSQKVRPLVVEALFPNLVYDGNPISRKAEEADETTEIEPIEEIADNEKDNQSKSTSETKENVTKKAKHLKWGSDEGNDEKAKKLAKKEKDLESGGDDDDDEEEDDKTKQTTVEVPDDTCPICLEQFVVGDAITNGMNCTHEFHRTCMMEWLKSKNKPTDCPTCRSKLWKVEEYNAEFEKIAAGEEIKKMIDDELEEHMRSPIWDRV